MKVQYDTWANLGENLTLDVIGNKDFGHNLKGCFLCSTRTLCNPQAITITKSEKPSFVFLKVSFTVRDRLTPEIACSTLMRILDILRLLSFSLAVSSFWRGFFSADIVYARSARTPESQRPYITPCALGTKCFLGRPRSYRAFFLGKFG